MTMRLEQKSGWNWTLVGISVILTLSLSFPQPADSKELPECSCNAGQCNSTSSTIGIFYCNFNNSDMCCKNSSRGGVYSQCEPAFNITKMGDCNIIGSTTCQNQSRNVTNSDCFNKTLNYLLNATCVSQCPCGYEANGTNCEEIIETTTDPSVNTTFAETTDAEIVEDPCSNPLAFPIYERKDKTCQLNTNFWLLIGCSGGGLVLLLIIIIVILACRCRRRPVDEGEPRNKPPGKDELGGKKGEIKRQQTIPNDYTGQRNQNREEAVPHVPDYGLLPRGRTPDPAPVQEDYENLELGSLDPDNGQEDYANVGTSCATFPDNHEEDGEIYGNDEIIRKQQDEAEATDQQIHYVRMDCYNQAEGVEQENYEEPTPPKQANDVGRKLEKLNKLLSQRTYQPMVPIVPERPRSDSSEEYTYSGPSLVSHQSPAANQEVYEDNQVLQYADTPFQSAQAPDAYDAAENVQKNWQDDSIYENVATTLTKGRYPK